MMYMETIMSDSLKAGTVVRGEFTPCQGNSVGGPGLT
jgi:hypothetical protein